MSIHIIEGESVSSHSEFYRVKHIQKSRDFYEKPCPKGLVCHWCVHEIHPRTPIPFPYKYNERRKTFRVDRQFCSWNCCLGFSQHWGGLNKIDRSMWIRLLSKYMHGHLLSKPIRVAPKREVLKMFGGSVDIEEFREGSVGTIILEEPPICTIIPEEHTILTKLKYKRVPSLPEQGKKNVSWADEQDKEERGEKDKKENKPILKKNNKSNYTLNNTKQHRGTKRRQKPFSSTNTQTPTQNIQKKNKKKRGTQPSQKGAQKASNEEEEDGLLQSLGITIRR